MDTWSSGTRAERIRPMARHWAEVGFGTPVVLHLFYVFKIRLYVLGAWLFALSTAGVDGFTDVAHWWSEPIVFQKVVLYTMAFEVIGLGCGFGPLNNRFFPPLGSCLYWLRIKTIRLPPWPQIPLTRGTARTPVDVLLYAGLLIALLVALVANGSGPVDGLTEVGLLPGWQIALVLVLLAVVGLRDKTIFLAARGEVYGTLTVTFLFTGVDMIMAAKLVFVVIWMGAATSKLNRHFPFVISTMMSNNPLVRARRLKQAFFENFPDDLRPDRPSRLIAHVSTAVEMLVPVALICGRGGWITTVAATVMVIFHLGILTAIQMGVPLEWNVFMIFGVLSLFVAHAWVGPSDLQHPAPVVLLVAVSAAVVIAGNLFPHKVVFPSRYAVLRRKLGHHPVVRQAVGQRQDRPQHRCDREHAASADPALLRHRAGTPADVHRVRIPSDELAWTRSVHPGAPGHGRSRKYRRCTPGRERVRHHRRRTDMQYGGGLEFR